MPVVLCLGQFRELTPNTIYRCRLCGKPVDLGNTGKAISHANGEYSYEHYPNECPEVHDAD